MVQVSQVCKDWYKASKDQTLDLAIRLLVGSSPSKCVFRQSIQASQNVSQILQICNDLYLAATKMFDRTVMRTQPDMNVTKNADPLRRITCDNLLVRQIHNPPNYQIVANFSEATTHWGNFYDVHTKQQLQIASNEHDLLERNRTGFACFFQNTLIKFDASDNRHFLSLNVYSFDEEGTCKFKQKICDLDDKPLYASDFKEYFAILTGFYAYLNASFDTIKIYKEQATELTSINHPTLLQQHSVCTAMCFARNRLVTGLSVLSDKQNVLLSHSQTSHTDSDDPLFNDFDIQNPCFNHLQCIDPDTGKLLLSKPQLSMIKQMAGDNNTLVIARGNFEKMIFEIWILDPLSLEDKFMITSYPVVDNALLKVEGNKIIVCSMRTKVLQIFNAFDGMQIIEFLPNSNFIDVAVTGNYAAIATGHAVEIWDLETKSRLKRIDTKNCPPEKIHFHIGEGDLDKTAYLIIALSNGEIHTWTLNT